MRWRAAVVTFFFCWGKLANNFVEPLQTLRFTPRPGRSNLGWGEKSTERETNNILPHTIPCSFLYFCHPRGNLPGFRLEGTHPSLILGPYGIDELHVFAASPCTCDLCSGRKGITTTAKDPLIRRAA